MALRFCPRVFANRAWPFYRGKWSTRYTCVPWVYIEFVAVIESSRLHIAKRLSDIAQQVGRNPEADGKLGKEPGSPVGSTCLR